MKKFKLYWLKGEEEIVEGETIREAMNRAGYGRVIMGALNYYKELKIENLEKDFELKQQPKKIPYTLETFPENALWIRNKNWKNGEKATFNVREDYNGNIRVWFFDCLSTENFEISDLDKAKNYEIGFLKDEKIQWKPFYQV